MSDPIEKAKGTAKEVAGKATGSDELAKEGEAQQDKEQRKAEADEAREEAHRKEQAAKGEKSSQQRHQ